MINNSEFTQWNAPDFTNEKAPEESETTLFGKPANWYGKAKADPIAEETKPLTLDDIEAIRQSAYEDGFNEGKQEGYEAGLISGTEEGEKQGYQAGFEKGQAEGLEQGKVTIDEQNLQWQSLIERLHVPLKKLDDNVEYQLVRLAMTLAEKIAQCEVKTNSQIILQTLKRGVAALPISEQSLTISLHPDDLNFVQEVYSSEFCAKKQWDLQGDPTLLRGDCQIITKTSSIDHCFESHIKNILQKFLTENHNKFPEKNDNSSLLTERLVEEPPVEIMPEIEPVITEPNNELPE
jgi:flagellar assembly protein FliH